MLLTLQNPCLCGTHAFERIYATSNHVWSYAGKLLIITRSLLNAAARTPYFLSRYGADFPAKVKLITTRLKLPSIVGVIFSFRDLKSTFDKMIQNLLSHNKEGVALNLLSFSITAIDIVDSTATFINSALDLSGRVPIERLTSLGTPLVGAMSILGIISRIIQIAKACGIIKSMKGIQHMLTKQSGDLLQTKNSLSNLIASEIPTDIKDKIKELHRLIKDNNLEKSEILTTIVSIHQTVKKKLILDGLGIFASTLTISALALFTLGSLGSAPFLLVASSFGVRIFSLAYQDLT